MLRLPQRVAVEVGHLLGRLVLCILREEDRVTTAIEASEVFEFDRHRPLINCDTASLFPIPVLAVGAQFGRQRGAVY